MKVFADFMTRIEVDWQRYCWNWTRGKIKDGYGRLRLNGKLVLAHRASKYLYGEMTEEDFLNSKKIVMHECDNPSCVNPSHLKVGTQQENIADRKLKGRTAKHLENRYNGRFIKKY